MAKAIAAYVGGIDYLIAIAVRDDGHTFQRVQSKGHYGYQWSKWKRNGFVYHPAPDSIESGGYILRRADDRYSNWRQWRLPGD